MPQCDRAAIYVDDFRIKPQVLNYCQGLDGKGFVEFNQANIANVQTCSLQDLSRCRDGAVTHDAWRDPRGG